MVCGVLLGRGRGLSGLRGCGRIRGRSAFGGRRRIGRRGLR